MVPKAVLIIERETNLITKRFDTSKMSESNFDHFDTGLVIKVDWERFYFRRVGPTEDSPRDFAEGETYEGE